MFKLKKATMLLFALPMALFLSHSAHAASYNVTPGDSLYSMGKLFNTSATTLMADNKLTNSTIYAGQVLNVPSATYTVKSGDTLYHVAKNNCTSLYSVRKLNNKWDNYIYPGQKLNIPVLKASSSQTPAAAPTASGISYTSSDLDLLARLVMAEAGSEPYTAKVAVAAVVVNRVQNPRFPNSVSGVVYQKDGGYYQFTPVENGWIKKAANQDSINAAKEALTGKDPTNGALYYFDDSTTNKWIWSKPIALHSGNMVYSY